MEKKQLNIDLAKIPNMRCYCGCDVFIHVHNLKYISPILCGDPMGRSGVVSMFRCTLCMAMYPKAMTADEVNRIYQKLDPEHKARIDELKAKLKEMGEKMEAQAKGQIDAIKNTVGGNKGGDK